MVENLIFYMKDNPIKNVHGKREQNALLSSVAFCIMKKSLSLVQNL